MPKPTSTHHKLPDRRHGDRSIPPPATFCLEELPAGALLTEAEVAAVLRVSRIAVEVWRRRPGHALTPVALPGGFVRYRAGDLRAYIAAGKRRVYRPNKQQAKAAPPSKGAAEQSSNKQIKRTRTAAARDKHVRAAE